MPDLASSIASRIRSAQTPAETLRQHLTQLERRVQQIGNGGPDVATETLRLLDEAHDLIEALLAQGGDLAAERTRFETITQQFDKRKPAFVKEAGGAAGLRQLRTERQPEPDRWWWYADAHLADEVRARRSQIVKRGGIVIAILAVLSLIYVLFLAPDEATRLRIRFEQAAEQALVQGDLPTAYAEAEEALRYAPDDPDLLVLKGVILQVQEEQAAADQLYSEAEARIGERDGFLTKRAQAYMLANRPDLALADGEAIVENGENPALGNFTMGNANAALGNYAEAIANYEEASALADASGQTELQGLARVQLANLMMMIQAPSLPATPTPTS